MQRGNAHLINAVPFCDHPNDLLVALHKGQQLLQAIDSNAQLLSSCVQQRMLLRVRKGCWDGLGSMSLQLLARLLPCNIRGWKELWGGRDGHAAIGVSRSAQTRFAHCEELTTGRVLFFVSPFVFQGSQGSLGLSPLF